MQECEANRQYILFFKMKDFTFVCQLSGCHIKSLPASFNFSFKSVKK